MSPTAWWKECVAYQVYPRSFMDSNGDGIGDLNGITSRLDHLVELGIDLVWLSPHFDSPNVDNGYDIRDYRKVMSEFGTMDDFDRMLAAMTERGIRLIIDLVVNHTSDQHEWFVASRSSRDDPHRSWYFWRDGVDGGPPNNYPSFFGGSAWTHDPTTDQWYLHYFAPEQPDLDWTDTDVVAEVYDLMRFWLDKGVSGFRMDVIPFISKQDGLPDLTEEQLRRPQDVYANGPRIHELLHDMHREVLAPYDAMSVGEVFGVNPDQAGLFVDERREELSMVFAFDLMRVDRDGWRTRPLSVPALKAAIVDMDRAAGEHGWPTSFLCNHDNPRAVSHYGDPSPKWWAASAKALATMMLTQRGTPFLYQGDEIGMVNFPFTSIEQFDDVEAKGFWRDLVETGRVPADELLANLLRISRDHARTPMQWTADAHGGFTTGTPWFAVNPSHVDINVAAQAGDPDSVLHPHRRAIALRRATPALVHGRLDDLDPAHEQVFVYTRAWGDETVLVVIDLSSEPAVFDLPDGVELGETLLVSGGAPLAPGSHRLELEPWQAVVGRATVRGR